MLGSRQMQPRHWKVLFELLSEGLAAGLIPSPTEWSEVITSKITTSEIITSQIDTSETDTSQIDTSQISTSEINSFHIGTSGSQISVDRAGGEVRLRVGGVVWRPSAKEGELSASIGSLQLRELVEGGLFLKAHRKALHALSVAVEEEAKLRAQLRQVRVGLLGKGKGGGGEW